jgi:heme exporter protein A
MGAVSNPPPALTARALSRGYGPRWALAGLNLELAAGRSLLVAGPNGAGKTTMLRLLAATLRPTSGTVEVLGKAPADARDHLGLLSHRTHLYTDLSCLENLSVAARLGGRDATKDRLDALLERVGLAGRGATRVRECSAGMRKRLAFARLLEKDPDVVLLDEPYGQLDPRGFDFVDRLIADLSAAGRTLVMSTHLVGRAAPLLQSGLLLVDGRTTWVGPSGELPAALQEHML